VVWHSGPVQLQWPLQLAFKDSLEEAAVESELGRE
jgi:hypothetical protein